LLGCLGKNKAKTSQYKTSQTTDRQTTQCTKGATNSMVGQKRTTQCYGCQSALNPNLTLTLTL